MKSGLTLLFSITLLVISCEQEADDPGIIEEEVKKDKIFFIDLDPDLVLHPVDSVGLHPSLLCKEVLPFPSDSLVDVELDLDTDGISDYRFSYSTYYEWVSNSSPCANYNSILSISSLFPSNEIVISNTEMSEIKIFNPNDTINEMYEFSDYAVIYRDASMAFLFYQGLVGDGYIGVRLSGGMLGWIKINFQKDMFTCSILKYAYNENVSNPILAGQTD